jgi:hypothetical protein
VRRSSELSVVSGSIACVIDSSLLPTSNRGYCGDNSVFEIIDFSGDFKLR